MQRLDARGLGCPEPLLMLKRELDVTSTFEIITDSNVAKENITRFLNTKGISHEITIEGEDVIFKVRG